MNDFELRFHPVTDPIAIVVMVAVLVALVWLRPRFGALNRMRWAAIAGLRLLVILLALVAMLRPELVYTKVTPVRAALTLLIDSSRSMQVADSLGDATRWESVKSLVATAADDLAALGESWDVAAYRFDADTSLVDIRDGQLTLPSTPAGEQTALGAALNDALNRQARGRVLGLLLLSDGAQRAIAPRDLPPQVAVRRMVAENIPLYTFTFGKSGGSERADLAIDDLVTNETIFAEAPTEVRGQLRVQGFANQRVPVQLLWESADGMKVVDTVQVDTGSEDRAVPVVLRHTPTTPGEYKVTLRVEPRDGELVTTNNEAGTFVTVRKGGVNVLYLVGAKRVGGGPGPEQRFVRAALARSPDIVVERRLVDYQPAEVDLRGVFGVRRRSPDLAENSDRQVSERNPSGAGSGDPRTTFDVVILDDVDARAISYESWQALANRVRAGAGLMMTGGYHSFGPGGHRETPLSDVLPIDFGPAQRQNFGEPLRKDVHLPDPVRMRPAAPIGVRHPIMQLEGSQAGGRRPDSNPEPWAELPPLDGANLIERRELKRNAIVLAEADDAARHPLLVAGQSGDGRTLAFAGDTTWKWPLQGFGEAHRRFWRQCVLWLAKKDQQTEGRVWIRLAGRRVIRGTRVDFTFGAEDTQGQPVASARFDVEVLTPDGEEIAVRPTKSGDDWAAICRDTTTPGDYRIQVTARDGEQQLGTAEARFLVPDQDIELDRPAAEPSLMAQLAEMTSTAGGQALAPEELPTLLARLAAQPPKLEEEVIARVTYWDKWPFLLLFIGLLSVEWYLRKRWGLV